MYIHVIKLISMTVKQLQEKLSTLDPEMGVLCEFDSDGDQFMIKVDIEEVYLGNNVDDTICEYDEKDYCIIKLKY